MTDKHMRSPDERLEPVNKDTTRDSDRIFKNTLRPDTEHPKDEVRHKYDAGDDDDDDE